MAGGYEQCFFFALGNCGPYKPRKKDGLFGYNDLQDSVVDFLKEKMKLVNMDISEYELIQNRSRKEIQISDKICANHRYNLGVDWRAPKRCQHPLHIEENLQSKKKSTNVRPASWNIYLSISKKYGNKFPLGGVLCTSHRNFEQKLSVDSPQKTPDHDVEYSPVGATAMSPEERQHTRESLDKLTETVAPMISPVKYQITSPVETVSEHTIRYAKRKYKQAKLAFKKKFCESVAPCQGEVLASIMSSSDEENCMEDNIPADLQVLHEAYNNCQTEKARILVLSTIEPAVYSKQEIMKIFDCSKYKVDAARKCRADNGVCGQMQVVSHTKNKLDLTKAEHFLNFLFQSGALQDVAYGTTTLKFTSGDQQVIPHAVLTALKSHTITEYLQFCRDLNFDPVHPTSLWNILSLIKPSQRHYLAGLDNTVAAGLNAFDTLVTLVKEVTEVDQNKILTQLEDHKRYLKIAYSAHCSENSACISHCSRYALSKPDEKFFQSACTVEHNILCSQCCSLLETLDQISKILSRYPHGNDERKAEFEYDFQISKEGILEWMRHAMRAAQQNRAKGEAVAELDSATGLWIRDWSQKVLPVKYRESQKEYFGKKGMSLHIDVFFRKVNDQLEKTVYFTCLFHSDQDVADTLCVANTVINQLRVDIPEISFLYAKSDNAGCYAGNGYAEIEHLICQKHGINLLRHDYNEPQKGKDQADRESAVAKRYISAYVNSGHDMTSPHDMKKGILYMGGVKNGSVAVLDIDNVKTSFRASPVDGISTYHSVSFAEDSMTFHKYYKIGVGKKIPYSSNAQFTSGAFILEAFSRTTVTNPSRQVSNTNKTGRRYQPVQFCPEANCCATFEEASKLDEHLAAGIHQQPETKTTADKIRLAFSKKLKEVVGTSQDFLTAEHKNISSEQPHPSVQHFFRKGWALPTRKTSRFTYAQKKFLYDMYIQGEKTKIKLTAEKAVKEMRAARTSLGTKMFQPSDYLTVSQVKSQFSRMANQQKCGKLQEPSHKIQDDDPDLDRDEDDLEEITSLASDVDEVQSILRTLQKAEKTFSVEVGDFVYVSCGVKGGKKHYVARVGAVQELYTVVSFMRKSGEYYVWPIDEDDSEVEASQIHLKLSRPDLNRREKYTFSEADTVAMARCCSEETF